MKTKRRTIWQDPFGGIRVHSKHGNFLGSFDRSARIHNKIVAWIPQSRKNCGVRCKVMHVCVTDDFGNLVSVGYA